MTIFHRNYEKNHASKDNHFHIQKNFLYILIATFKGNSHALITTECKIWFIPYGKKKRIRK